MQTLIMKAKPDLPAERLKPVRMSFLGSPVDSLSMDEALIRLQEFIQSRSPHLVVAFNVPKLWRMQGDSRLKEIVESADLILPEPVIALASRWCRNPLKGYIGNDRLTLACLPLAAKEGIRLYFLGTRPSSLENMLNRLREQYPGIIITGSHHGYFADDEAESIAEHIRSCCPHFLFVGMGTPKQEYWMGTYGRTLGVPVVIGVGGTLDVLAGLKHDCPAWIRALGLEWLFRVIEDPRSKFKRYFVALPWFLRSLVLKGILPNWFGTRNVAKN